MAEGIIRPESPVSVAVKDKHVIQDPDSKAPAVEPEISLPDSSNKRRGLFKGLLAAAGFGATAAVIGKELSVPKEGIVTGNAVFIPLYENHNKRLSAERIPEDLDLLAKEGIPQDFAYDTPADRYITAQDYMPQFMGSPRIPLKRFEDGILEKIARNGIKIAPVDINIGMPVEEAAKFIKVSATAELAAAVAAGGYAFGRDAVDEIKDRETSAGEISRRKMLKVASGGLALGAASYIGSKVALNSTGNLEQDSAVKRIITRINGFQSNFHPEDLAVFFRNVFIAGKLLTIAEEYSSGKGQKLKIGFNYADGHTGIEDLLRAGPDFCRLLISSFPKDYLSRVIQANSSAENLSSVMLINLPRDFKTEDLKSPAKLSEIRGTRVMDAGLLEKLRRISKAA